MNSPTFTLTKAIYDLSGNGLEIVVDWDPQFEMIESVKSAHAVIFGSPDRIDQTDILLEHGDLTKLAEAINWKKHYEDSKKDDHLFDLGRKMMRQAITEY